MEGRPDVGSAEEVGRLADALQDPVFRRSFTVDPDAALANADLNAGEIPEALLNTLKGLSLHELGFLARVNHELRDLKGDTVMVMAPL